MKINDDGLSYIEHYCCGKLRQIKDDLCHGLCQLCGSPSRCYSVTQSARSGPLPSCKRHWFRRNQGLDYDSFDVMLHPILSLCFSLNFHDCVFLPSTGLPFWFFLSIWWVLLPRALSQGCSSQLYSTLIFLFAQSVSRQVQPVEFYIILRSSL